MVRPSGTTAFLRFSPFIRIILYDSERLIFSVQTELIICSRWFFPCLKNKKKKKRVTSGRNFKCKETTRENKYLFILDVEQVQRSNFLSWKFDRSVEFHSHELHRWSSCQFISRLISFKFRSPLFVKNYCCESLFLLLSTGSDCLDTCVSLRFPRTRCFLHDPEYDFARYPCHDAA